MIHPVRILVAEDDPHLLDSVVMVLEPLSAEVIQATSGAELLRRIEEQGPFDLIITDVSMPWMSGPQALLAAQCAGQNTAILVMTASQDERISRQIAALGPRARLLRKPFDLSDLESVIAALLSST